MASSPQEIRFFNVFGRNGATPPFKLLAPECMEALNVDWFESSLGRKRGGASSISLTGGTAQTGVTSFLFSHLPSVDQSARELWSVDDAATPRWKRLTGGTAWADVSVADAVSSKPWEINAVSFNNKAFFAYDSPVNRLHCWDGSSFRTTSITKSAAPAVANTGVGTYAATGRYYRVRFVVVSGSNVIRAGEVSNATALFTPSGTGTAARVTKPSNPGEGETHWELFASNDGAEYWRIARTVIATTTFDDSTLTTAYDGVTGILMPTVNSWQALPSCKYLVADQGRLVMAGVWETTDLDTLVMKSNRFWWTAPLGATDNGDDERISNTSEIKNYDDIEEDITGLGGTMNGSIFVFSYGGVWKAIGTGLPAAPYSTVRIAGALGCIQHKTIIKAEDEDGEPCLYWLSPVGPVRFGAHGFQRLFQPVSDIWRGVNLAATTIVGHGVYHRDKHQIWWWVATGSNNEPDTKIVFDINLGRIVEESQDNSVAFGWAKHTGESSKARCSCMMSDTLGATMSRTLKPHIGYQTGTAIWKCDTGTTDTGTAYQSYILSQPFTPWGVRKLGALIEEAFLIAGAGNGVSIQLSVIKDFGLKTGTSTLSLNPTGTQTRIFKEFSQSKASQANTIQFQIGDSAAVDSTWNLDMLVSPWAPDGVR